MREPDGAATCIPLALDSCASFDESVSCYWFKTHHSADHIVGSGMYVEAPLLEVLTTHRLQKE